MLYDRAPTQPTPLAPPPSARRLPSTATRKPRKYFIVRPGIFGIWLANPLDLELGQPTPLPPADNLAPGVTAFGDAHRWRRGLRAGERTSLRWRLNRPSKQPQSPFLLLRYHYLASVVQFSAERQESKLGSMSGMPNDKNR